METANGHIDIGELLTQERIHIQNKRKKQDRPTKLEDDSLAIALSGGGIRSATICLGVLKELHKKKILSNTDYLSTVSGGGYIGSYIHTALKNTDSNEFEELFVDDDITHLRSFRKYLYLLTDKNNGKIDKNKETDWKTLFNKLYLLFTAFISILSNMLWLLIPALILFFVPKLFEPIWFWWLCKGLTAITVGVTLGYTLHPNRTSLHHFYKTRLRKAYLFKDPTIRLKSLKNDWAPYPLVNATVHVNYDSYAKQSNISYRGQIKSNYFLFSPCFCGSQVTGYVKTDSVNYENLSLASAMATSGAAVNTFMGNQDLSFVHRNILSILNLRTGILAANPRSKSRIRSFWPYYTYLELMGNPKTDTSYVQVSDGGHIENLAVYELLRRKVKTIIAIDAGADDNFEFGDLRNLVVRANSELGIKFDFHENANPEDIIRPNAVSGFSKKQFVVARLTAMDGSYAEGYDGLFIYIKSSVLENDKFNLRAMKREIIALSESKENQNISKITEKKRRLNSKMYQTYNPDFPHESTSDQFFDESQWNAYYELGQAIGSTLCSELKINEDETGKTLLVKGKTYYESYDTQIS